MIHEEAHYRAALPSWQCLGPLMNGRQTFYRQQLQGQTQGEVGLFSVKSV